MKCPLVEDWVVFNLLEISPIISQMIWRKWTSTSVWVSMKKWSNNHLLSLPLGLCAPNTLQTPGSWRREAMGLGLKTRTSCLGGPMITASSWNSWIWVRILVSLSLLAGNRNCASLLASRLVHSTPISEHRDWVLNLEINLDIYYQADIPSIRWVLESTSKCWLKSLYNHMQQSVRKHLCGIVTDH